MPKRVEAPWFSISVEFQIDPFQESVERKPVIHRKYRIVRLRYLRAAKMANAA